MIQLLRRSSLLVALALSSARPAAAAPSEPAVQSVTRNGYRVRVPIGEPVVTRGTVYGFDLAELSVPGGTPESAPAGGPPLPVRTVLLSIPWGVQATVSAVPGTARSLGALRLAPFPYLITEPAARDIRSGPEVAAALAAPGYSTPAGARLILRSVETAAGGDRLLAVTIAPVSWNPATGEVRYVEDVTLDVRWDPVEPVAGAPRGGRPSLSPGNAVAAHDLPAAAAVGPTAAPRRMRVDPSRPWVRLAALRPGLYALAAGDLAGAGVAVGGIDPATFRLYRGSPGALPESVDVDLGPDSLRECAIAVDEPPAPNGSFDAADRIYFYATGYTGFGYDLVAGGGPAYQDDQWTDQEPLWLTWGPGPTPDPPRRMGTRDAAPITPAVPLFTSVTHRVHFEENRVENTHLFRPPYRWERWFHRLMTQGTRAPFILQLPGALAGGACALDVRMWGLGLSIGAGIPDHVVRIYWNRQLADTAGWDLYQPQDLGVSGLRVGVRDTLEIEVPVLSDPPYPRGDQSYLAWFELTYPRRLAALNDTIQFAAPDSLGPGRARYSISAIGDTASAWLLDRSDPESPIRLTGGAWTGAAPAYALTVEDSVGLVSRSRYSLVSTARAARPVSITLYAPPSTPHAIADLLDELNGADYLIVAPAAFVAQAESLAAFRSQTLTGIPAPRARIATLERVYAQLGSGRTDPTAIRNLMVYARRYWAPPAPTYLCLLGDGSSDPKNYTGLNAPDLVPSYPNYWDPSTVSQYVSDDYYALLDGPTDRLVDLAVGRLPAGDPMEALWLVTGKLRTFEATGDFDIWRARALLAADDANQRDEADPIANGHVNQMERKSRFHIPYPVEESKVYLNDFAFADTTRQSKPAAREEFIAQINRGNWLVEWIGHGAENVIADEQLFRSADIPRLTNVARPSIFGFFSCTVGKFDVPLSEPLAEQLLTYLAGGAAASIAATDEAFGSRSTVFNDAIMDELFPLAPRVDSLLTTGLAYARAKNTNVNDTVRKYAYLGDPALRAPIPRGRAVWEKGPLDSLLRGEAVTLRGHALMPDSSADTLSTGTVELLVEGPPLRRTQTAPFDNSRATYFVPGVTLYRGTAALDRGAFEARFVVPVDGRIVGSGARLRALLSSAGGRGVGLAVDSVIVAAGASSRVDATPPTIDLIYPVGSDSTLRAGERVTFAIEDSSGIDLTRLDNAHTIFVIVDDKGTPTELTPGFAYDPGSHTRGRVEYVLPALSAGPHQLEVHASDTYRNIGSRIFVIDVSAGGGSGSALVLDQVFNYPNPFPRETYLHARLNQQAELRIQILTVAGRRVRELQADGRAGENLIPWDGRDSEGENVALGVYLFKVTAESPSGNRVTAIGRALRTQ